MEEPLKILQRVRIPTDKLRPNNGQLEGIPKNPRFIRDDKYRKLLRSIKDNPEMLTLRELVAVPWGGLFVVVGGNMRLRALKELGHKEAVCTVVPEGWTMDQIKDFILKDNSSFGEWDIDDLLNEWEEARIAAAAIDIPDIPDPKDSEGQDAEDDNFDVSGNTPKKATSRDGDLYRLGNHRLICGDSTKEEYLEALMGDEQADLLVTDPPYNVDYNSKNEALNAAGKGNRVQRDIANDSMDAQTFKDFLCKAFANANTYLKPGGVFYIWHAGTEGLNFKLAVKETGWELKQILIWVKNNIVLGRLDYQWKHEPCLYGWKPGASHYFVARRDLTTLMEDEALDLNALTKQELKDLLTKVLSLPTTDIHEDKPMHSAGHPTMKPVPLIGRLISNSSRRKGIVLDIFGGSGTTLIAAEQLGRCCRMVEFEPVYVDVIIKRWEELTGMKAQLIGNIHEGREPKEGGQHDA